MADELHKIKSIIEAHVGKGNQISAGKIGDQIGIHEDATHVRVRGLIRDTIAKYRIPVGAGNRGYYLIASERELREYVENIDSRIAEMQERKKMVEVAFKNRCPIN